ncbi:Holliday junction branch migration protein RuvA [Treponema sp.]|uniref:Holliday junction branch migration protein RuvA n=1 Tax=Treponema sp. TaxID=166 RepID=UPI003F11F738
MFNSLTGIVTGKFPQKLLIETNGIEWDVTVPETSLEKIPPVGSKARVFVWMQHNENAVSLFGFSSEDERALFFDLLKVDGIGPKGATKIMGSVSFSALAQMLDRGDVDALKKVPGVGPKTAGKIILSLKGKLSLASLASTNSETLGVSASYSDVVNALVDMGYDRSRAEEVVYRISAALKSDEQFASLDQSGKEDFIFRKSIVELAR